MPSHGLEGSAAILHAAWDVLILPSLSLPQHHQVSPPPTSESDDCKAVRFILVSPSIRYGLARDTSAAVGKPRLGSPFGQSGEEVGGFTR